MVFSTWVSLAIEFSGLLHAVYLVQYLFAALTGNPVETKEPAKEGLTAVFFWLRVLMSCAILAFAWACTIDSLYAGVTTMWTSVPSGGAVTIFIVILVVVGIMEGLQIAAFAVVKLPEESYMTSHKVAYVNCKLLFKGNNFARFLIGRQIFVCTLTFVAARVVSVDGK